MADQRVKSQQTIFDPFINKQNRKEAKYEFTEFESRFGISELMNSVKNISSISEMSQS